MRGEAGTRGEGATRQRRDEGRRVAKGARERRGAAKAKGECQWEKGNGQQMKKETREKETNLSRRKGDNPRGVCQREAPCTC